MKNAIQISNEELNELLLLADSNLKRAKKLNAECNTALKDIQELNKKFKIQNCIESSECNQEKL